MLDRGFLSWLSVVRLSTGALLRILGRSVNHLVGRLDDDIFVVQLIMAQTHDAVCRRFEVHVRNQQDRDLVAQFDGMNIRTLLVEEEGRNVDRNLRMHGGRVVLHSLFFEDAQDMQRSRFGRADMAGACAARAGDVAGFSQGRTQALARQFHQAEAADLAHLHAGAVVMQRIAQTIFDFALVLAALHIDEVDDDQATEVAQAKLAGQFFSGFQVRLECRFFDIGATGRATGVHVAGNQSLGVVDDDRATRRQVDLTRIGGFDLVFDLEAGEERHVIVIALDAADVARHDRAHEGARLLIDIVGIDQDFANVRLEVVADGANDQTAFEVDQERTRLLTSCAFDGCPQLQQVIQVPLQLFGITADGRSAGNQAHPLRDLQLIHDLAQFCALIAFDAA